MYYTIEKKRKIEKGERLVYVEKLCHCYSNHFTWINICGLSKCFGLSQHDFMGNWFVFGDVNSCVYIKGKLTLIPHEGR